VNSNEDMPHKVFLQQKIFVASTQNRE